MWGGVSEVGRSHSPLVLPVWLVRKVTPSVTPARFCVWAIQAARAGHPDRARRLLAAADAMLADLEGSDVG